MTRREFSDKVKIAAFQRANGCCECPTHKGKHHKIITTAHYDHIVPDALGGEPTLDNCMVLDPRCHRMKTSKLDVPAIAKGKRIEKKRAGVSSSRPMPGSKRSGWKRKMDGTTVRRET